MQLTTHLTESLPRHARQKLDRMAPRGQPITATEKAIPPHHVSSRGTSHGSKNLVTAEEPHRLIVKRNLTGEQGKSTTTPGTSPRRNSNQRNLDPEEPPARRTSEQQRNLTASSSRGTSQVRGPDSQRQGEIQGKKRQGVAQGKKVRRDTPTYI